MKPYKQTISWESGQTDSGAVDLTNVDVRAILWGDSGIPGAATTVSLKSGTITTKVDNTSSGSLTFSVVNDSTKSLITISIDPSKVTVLSEAQRDAFRACHWVKLVSNVAAASACSATLIGFYLHSGGRN